MRKIMQFVFKNFRWILLLTLPGIVFAASLIWLWQIGWNVVAVIDPVLVICLLFFIYLHLVLFSYSKQCLTRKVAAFVILSILGGGYLIYAIKSDSFSYPGFAKHIIYLTIPMVVSFLNERYQYTRKTYSDLFFILWMWIFFDLRMLNGIWVWPDAGIEYPATTIVLMISLMIWFRGIRGFHPGLPLTLSPQCYKITGIGLIVFSALVIPIGFMSQFLTWNPSGDLARWILAPFGIFFFIALPEELVFRGLLLTIIARHFNYASHQSYGKPLIVSSVLFGLSHFNNAPLNDWRYLSLSTLAGFFYGFTYLKSKNLGAPVLLHTLVDYLWIGFFLKT